MRNTEDGYPRGDDNDVCDTSSAVSSQQGGGGGGQRRRNSISPSGGDHLEEGNREKDHDSNDDDNDDRMMVCRCESPKVLVDLLQAFSKTGSLPSNNSSRKTITTAATTTTATSTTMSQRNDGTQLASSLLYQQPMTFFCSPHALTIHFQSSNKQFQASMELPSSFFSHYQLQVPIDNREEEQEDVLHEFTVYWHTLLQCLNVLLTTSSSSYHGVGNNSNNNYNTSVLTMSYHTSTELLRLEWETTMMDTNHSTILATAAIPGLIPPQAADEAAELTTAFASTPIQARWLSSSHQLKEAKFELESIPGAQFVQVQFWKEEHQPISSSTHARYLHNNSNPSLSTASCGLRLTTRGYSSQVTVEFHDVSSSAIHFTLDENLGLSQTENNPPHDTVLRHSQRQKKPKKRVCSFTYSWMHWKQALQPLDMATETCLSVNQDGIMAIQHQLVIHHDNTDHHPHNNNRENSNVTTTAQVDHNQQESLHKAYCDFLLLPMVDEEDNDQSLDDEDDDDSNEEDEESTALLPLSVGWKTQSSQNTKEIDDHDEQSTQTTQDTQRRPLGANNNHHRRRNPNNPNMVGDDNDHGTSILPLESSDDDDGDEITQDTEAVRLARKQPPSQGNLFPTLTGVGILPHQPQQQQQEPSSQNVIMEDRSILTSSDNATTTSTTGSLPVTHAHHHRRDQQRKRQRRRTTREEVEEHHESSKEIRQPQQQSSRNNLESATTGIMDQEQQQEEGQEDGSINLLEDSPLSSNQRRQSVAAAAVAETEIIFSQDPNEDDSVEDGGDDDDDDGGSFSSTEIVYGE